MSPASVAVIGAGNGGLAVAGWLALRGCSVALHDVDPAPIEALRERGGIRLTGKLDAEVAIRVASTRVEEVVPGAETVVIVVPGPDVRAAARALAPHLDAGTTVLVKPGGTGGALEVGAVLREAGVRGVAVAEADGFLFACSVPEPAHSHVAGVKAAFAIALLPGDGAPADGSLAPLDALFPQARRAPSVLHTGLTNLNAVLHVAPMVANAGRVESGVPFAFYGDGITPAVARLVAAYDRERLAVASALGVEVPSLAAWASDTYGVSAPDPFALVQALQREVYGPLPAPSALLHRYLTEDVPCGAVPVAGLGALVGVATPVHDGLIALAGALCEVDFRSEGRSAERLGLAGADAAAIRARAGAAA